MSTKSPLPAAAVLAGGLHDHRPAPPKPARARDPNEPYQMVVDQWDAESRRFVSRLAWITPGRICTPELAAELDAAKEVE